MNKRSEPAKPFKLTLDGKPLELSPPAPTQDKLVRFLTALPDGELLTKSELMNRTHVARGFLIESAGKSLKLSPYRYMVSHRIGYMFGNPKTIIELIKHVKAMQGEL